MERELNELKAELRRRDEADRRRAAEGTRAKSAPRATAHAVPGGAGSPTAAAPAAAPSSTAAAPAAVPSSTAVAQTATSPDAGEPASSVNAAAVRSLVDRVRLGGYGSMRYEGSSLSQQHNTFTFRRFVLSADADIAPRLRSYLELEFERFRELELEKKVNATPGGGLQAEQAVDGTDSSEISF